MVAASDRLASSASASGSEVEGGVRAPIPRISLARPSVFSRVFRILGHAAAPAAICLLLLVPTGLAFLRLIEVGGIGPIEAALDLESRFQTRGVVGFTFTQAILSSLATISFGLPIAWWLGRHDLPAKRLLRAIMTAPFVMPSILAALAFVALLGPSGWLTEWLGLDLHGTIWAILIAHTWFNLALVIRFVEPAITRVDPHLEEAIRLLPVGRTPLSRAWNLWRPLLAPYIAAAAVLTFVFSYTSFALVRHLGGPDLHTVERAMAERGTFAGIDGIGVVDSQVVLGLGTVQLLVMIAAFLLYSVLQQRTRSRVPLAPESRTLSPLPRLDGSVVSSLEAVASRTWIMLGVLFAIFPAVSLFFGSFEIRGEFSLEAWQIAFGGGAAHYDIRPPLLLSLQFAVFSVILTLPIAILLTRSIVLAERRGDVLGERVAIGLDLLAMSPLALSAVMVGYGLLIGILRVQPDLMFAWWLPIAAHTTIALPFAVRAMLPPARALDPIHGEAAAILGAGVWRRSIEIYLPLMKGPLVVAAGLIAAVSLGEFGATLILWTNPDWLTLPVFIDDWLGRPFDPIPRPIAHVAGVILWLLVVATFEVVDRFRVPGQEGDF